MRFFVFVKNGISLLVLTCLLGGCAYYNQKFKSDKELNIGEFSDYTVTMINQISVGIKPDQSLLIRRFIDSSSEEEKELREMLDLSENDVRLILAYSIDVAGIVDSNLEEDEKIHEYVKYIEQYRTGIVERDIVTAAEFDETLLKILNANDMFEAMQEAQPILNASVINLAKDLDLIIDQVYTVAATIEEKIDREYALTLGFMSKVDHEKQQIMRGIELVYDAYSAMDVDLSPLSDEGIIRKDGIIPDTAYTQADLELIVNHFQQRLDYLNLIEQEISSDWELYKSTHAELDLVTQQTIDRLGKVRVFMLTWVRAHQKLASGKTVPADWFDIQQLTSGLISTTPRLLH